MLNLSDLLAKYDHGGALYAEFTVTRKATGETVARRQFMHRDEVRTLPVPAVSAAPAVRETDGEIILCGESFTAVFSKADGMLKEYTSGSIQKVLGSRISINRPYSGLDCKPGWGWRNAMDEARATMLHFGAPEILAGRNCVAIKTTFGGKLLRGEIGWTVYGDGSVLCALDGQMGEGLKLPRLGVEFTVPGDMSEVAYTGYGPVENYSDRMLAARFGKYAASVDELGYDYAPPSENGGREGTVALHLKGESGALHIAAANPFHFDARRCTVADLQTAMHTHELPRRSKITLHLDAWHMPIGGDMAWSTMIDPADAPHAGFHSLRAMIR